MTSTVERSVGIAAPVAEVFAYVDDYTLTKEWMSVLRKIEPVGRGSMPGSATRCRAVPPARR
jgi:uncharacterized protein YndB with AHSA1/START domain